MVTPHYTPPDHDLELLSAYLDGELPDRERVSLEHRLDRETELRAALDDLRAAVTMVRDLPRLKAPRNFTLDPAIYSHPVPWWKQLFTLGNILQLSGAMGAVAAIMIIASAFLLGGDSASDEADAPQSASEQAAESGSVAIAPSATRTPIPATAFAFEHATAIANANTDAVAFDATLIAQSAMYASTEVFGTMTAEGIEVVEVQANAVGEAVEEATAEANVGFAAGGDGLTNDTINDAAMEAPAPPQPLVTNSSPQPEGPTMLQVNPPSNDGDTSAGMMVTDEPMLGMAESAPAAANTAADDNALREKETTATSPPTITVTPEPTQSPSPTPIRDTEADHGTIAPMSPTPVMYAQAPADESEQAASTEPTGRIREKDQDDSGMITWLAGLGALVLVVSLALFVVGRRRS